MSTTYRQTRNIEASIIDHLTTNFNADWSGVTVEKTFKRVYEVSLPVICVRVGITSHESIEIGTDSTWRRPQLLIDIFATSDGQKHDLVDYIITKIKSGFVYYDYIITNGIVDTKTANGRIRVLKPINVTNINFDEDKDSLDVHDRYRSLITSELSLGRVET